MPWSPTEQPEDEDDGQPHDGTRTETAGSLAGDETPPVSEEDEDDADDVYGRTNMDEEDYWFEISRQQLRYPEDMREVRGECQEQLIKKEQMRHAYDGANPEAANEAKAEAKKVRRNLKKKARKAAAKK